jgi:hypothetical protein
MAGAMAALQGACVGLSLAIFAFQLLAPVQRVEVKNPKLAKLIKAIPTLTPSSHDTTVFRILLVLLAVALPADLLLPFWLPNM